jgi:hypothetical protein
MYEELMMQFQDPQPQNKIEQGFTGGGALVESDLSCPIIGKHKKLTVDQHSIPNALLNT